MSTRFPNRKYIVFATSELSSIDFNQVRERSIDTIRKNIDGTKSIVSWNNTIPSSVVGLTTYQGPYNNDEMRTFMDNASSEWYEDSTGGATAT